MYEKIVFGCDHNGITLKRDLIFFAKNLNYETYDCSFSQTEDYLDITKKVVHQMLQNQGSFGVLICGSGFGVCIAANRHPLVRAALCRSKEDTEFCRRQNDANILCLGAEFTNISVAQECLLHFVTRPFKKERHQEHVDKLLLKSIL